MRSAYTRTLTGRLANDGRHTVAVTLEGDEAGWRNPLGMLDKAVERRAGMHIRCARSSAQTSATVRWGCSG